MLNKFLLTVSFMLCFGYSYAQRLSFDEVLHLYDYTTDNNDHNLNDINTLLKANAENWTGPAKGVNGDALSMTWTYKVENHEMGYLQAYKETHRLDNGQNAVLYKMTYYFPYQAEYDVLLQNIAAKMSLVNTFTDHGEVTRVYEGSYLTFALVTMPASLNRFFIDGRPVDSYMLVIHRKL